MVASSFPAFAELLRLSLSESKKYQIQIVASAEEMLTLAGQTQFDLAILDADTPDQEFTAATDALRSVQPGIKVMVFPPENRADHPSMRTVRADAFLSKPFYLPQLVETMETILGKKAAVQANNNGFKPVTPKAIWQQEGVINEVLALTLQNSQARAIIVITHGVPFAYRGDLGDSIPQEVATILLHDWDKTRRNDIVRFKRLGTDSIDYLIYATVLDVESVLVVIYEKSTSLTSARSQTITTVRTLQKPPAYLTATAINETKIAKEPLYPEAVVVFPAKYVPSADMAEDDEVFEDEELSPIQEAEMIKLAELLASMPSPDPDSSTQTVIEPFANTSWTVENGEEPLRSPEIFVEKVNGFDEIPEWLAAAQKDLEQHDQETTEIPGWLEEREPLTTAEVPVNESQSTVDSSIPNWLDLESESTNEKSGEDDAVPYSSELPEWLEMPVETVPQTAPTVAAAIPDWLEIPKDLEEAAQKPENALIFNNADTAEQPTIAEIENTIEKETENSVTDMVFSWEQSNTVHSEDETALPNVLKVQADEPTQEPDFESILKSMKTSSTEEPEIQKENEQPDDQHINDLLDRVSLSAAAHAPTIAHHSENNSPVGVSLESEDEAHIQSEETQRSAAAEAPTIFHDSFAETQAVRVQHFFNEEPVDPLGDTAPRKVLNGIDMVLPQIEPELAGVSSLNYTSVLLPRFPEHFLIGELAEKLSQWVPQLCLAYGWRLERISVRPQYIQWTIQVSPAYSPRHLVRMLREETSRRVFTLRPDYAQENPSEDFWAPGYLMLSGYLPPTQQMLNDFIHQTRRRQGIEH